MIELHVVHYNHSKKNPNPKINITYEYYHCSDCCKTGVFFTTWVCQLKDSQHWYLGELYAISERHIL